jgi:uncharacterized protein
MNEKPAEAMKIAGQFIEALARLDAEAQIALLHEDAVLECPFPVRPGENAPGTRRQTGAGLREGLRQSARNTAEVQFNNRIWRTSDDGLAILQADGECMMANGNPYRNHYVFMFEIADGKVIRWWEYLNPVISARAVGMPLESIP